MKNLILIITTLLHAAMLQAQCPASIASLGVGNGLQVCWNNNEAPAVLDDIKYDGINYAGNFVNGGSGDCWRTSQAATLSVNGNHQIEFRVGNTDWICNSKDGEVDTEPVNMPVAYKYIDVSFADNEVLVAWATASEENSAYFEIERSADAISFETVGTVEAQNMAAEYTFSDEYVHQGQWYYRLKQVDKDGLFEYTSIQSILLEDDVDPVISIFPVPVRNTLYLQINKSDDIAVEFSVYALSGQLLHQQNFNTTEQTELSVNVAGWHSGCYIIECKAHAFTFQKKFIKH